MGALLTRPELENILEGCIECRRSSQKRLVEVYTPMLLFTARRYTSDLSKAKDIVQESFINIFNAIHNFSLGPVSSFENWIRKIVINNALKEKRKSHLKKELNGFESLPEVAIEAKAIEHLSSDEMLKMIEKIPEGYRVVFQMYVIDGYSHKEISEILKISSSTSRSQLVRARSYLRKVCFKENKSLTS